MPLSAKGKKILRSRRKTYGKKKGTSVFYASIRGKKIKGTERKKK